jgi:hypothetical protein
MSTLRSVFHRGVLAMTVSLLACSGALRVAAQAAPSTPTAPAATAPAASPAAAPAPARPAPTPEQLAVQAASEKDHQRMMDLLGIKELRRGADGDAKSPYAANYDESKADVYPNAARPAGAQERQASDHGGGVVERAAAGDCGGLRPGDLWPRSPPTCPR